MMMRRWKSHGFYVQILCRTYEILLDNVEASSMLLRLWWFDSVWVVMRIVLFFIALFFSTPVMAAFDSSEQAVRKDLSILRITPEGDDVPKGRQIVIQFNRPVVPVGAMERKSSEIPVEITPTLACQWRWLNTSALSCNLDEKNELTLATRYAITVHKGLAAEDGATLAGDYAHSFITERPDVRYAWFQKWLSPTLPVIRLTFNQSVTRSSVEKALYISAADNPLGQVVALKVEQDPNDRELPAYLPVPTTKMLVSTAGVKPQKSDDDVRKVQGEEARRVWQVTPLKALPADAAMSLRVRAGLVSALGMEAGVSEREVVRFDTFPALSFVGVKCYTNEDNYNQVLIEPNKPETARLCNPMRSVALAFSAPVFPSMIKKHVQFSPPIAVDAEAAQDPWGDGHEYSQLSQAHAKGKTYDIFLPAGIKAATTYHMQTHVVKHGFWMRLWLWLKSWFVELPLEGLRDEFGRALSAPINFSFETNHRKPNFVIAHNDAVIEKGVDSEVPLYVNNLTSTSFLFRRLTVDGAAEGLTATQQIPNVRNIQFAVPFQVRDMLGGKSGAVYGTLTTQPTVAKSEREHRLFAQVTPFQVHVKLGHFNSAIWVMDMATGLPVQGAKVSIYKDKLTTLQPMSSALSQGVTDAVGIVLLDGTVTLDPMLELYKHWRDEEERLFVRVEKDGDMALLPVNNDFMIDSYRSVGESVYPSNQEQYGHIKTWGTTAQGVYRLGDTIQYKIYVRNQDNKALVAAPVDGYVLEIKDPTDTVVQKIENIKLNAFGAYAGELPLPKTGVVGWYQFRLTSSFAKRKEWNNTLVDKEWYPLRVLVSDFTTSPFKVTNHINGDVFKAKQQVEVSSQAQMHAGGAYTDANIRVVAMLESKSFSSKDPLAQGFYFGSADGGLQQQEVFQKIDRVDGKGEHRISFTVPTQSIFYGRLMVESAVQDERGKYVTTQAYADYAGVDRFIGMRLKDWVFTMGKQADIDTLVTDEKGVPVAGVATDITIERQVTKAAKVKGAGNAYVSEFTNAWVAASACKAMSSKAVETCHFTPKEAGYYRIIAKVKDTQGLVHRTEQNIYVVGTGHVLWNESNDYSLEIIPEKTSYKIGDKARYLIKNPYPHAKALVTIERYGVMDHFVQTLEGSTPIIEFDVKPDYLPGFYLSVVAFSERVSKPIEGQVDLGKPTFRMGYVTVPIQDDTKEILVSATTDKQVYKPRDKVMLSLHAEPRVKDKQEPVEVAVAVLDEAVFDLIMGGKDYFDPYKGFYSLDGLDLRNYSLLTRLVGRQKFEKKGANAGGDGGSDLAMRNLFKFVSYWNPSVPLDAAGNAQVSFDVPDNLTGWRVLALAVTPTDRMGLGDANFKVNRPTEIRPVMPNQVSEGDGFDAGFSVMNRTDKKRDILVTIEAKGLADAQKHPLTFQKKITLEAYKRQTLVMPVLATRVPEDANQPTGAITFTVSAEDALDGDAITYVLEVRKRRALEAAATYGTTTADSVDESLKVPDHIHGDVGDISVVMSPSIIGNIQGAFEYLRDYPYYCWEQILTKGVMASHYLKLKAYTAKDFVWKEAESLPVDALKAAKGYQAPNGGMTYFVPTDDHVDPYLSAYTALAFNWLRAEGYVVPVDVEQALHGYLLNLLKHDVYPSFYDKGMASTVRAVALAALAEHNKVTLADLQRYKAFVPQMSLFGKNYFVQAAMRVPQAEPMVAEVTKLMLSHASQSGGKFTFSEELDDSYSRMLASPLRENCAILSTMTALGERPESKALVEDVPFKLVRMITQVRGSRTHWENTQENVFCTRGLIDYAKIYEAQPPHMTVDVALDDVPLGQAQFASVQDKAVTLSHPLEAKDVGRAVVAHIKRAGEGRLYYAARMRFSPLQAYSSLTNAGIDIRKEYSVERAGKWVMLDDKSQIKQGDIVRADIFMSLPTAREFVVIDDPVPGGLEPVNRDLATASVVDAQKGAFEAAGGSWWFKFDDWIGYNATEWSFYHQELRHHAVRFYSDYLPAGNYHVSYTAQAIASGDFVVMPVHAEEMYDPDVFGKGVERRLQVAPQQ